MCSNFFEFDFKLGASVWMSLVDTDPRQFPMTFDVRPVLGNWYTTNWSNLITPEIVNYVPKAKLRTARTKI